MPQELAELCVGRCDRIPTNAHGAPNTQMTLPLATFYDAFLSYRHVVPDRNFAWSLVERLEAAGFRVAIDERDFRPAQTFLEEMERCIRASRYTLALLSPQYLQSGNTFEEAVICKVLDMGERRRRLVPLILEQVERPTWLYNIVGIDFANPTPAVDPFEKLCQMLHPALGQGPSSDSGCEPSHPSAVRQESDRSLASRFEQLRQDAKKVFTPKVPVIDKSFLFGRDILLSRIAREMEMRGSSIVLYGPANSGKTSILRFLKKRENLVYCSAGRDHTWSLIARFILDRFNVSSSLEEYPFGSISPDEAAERLSPLDGLVIVDAFENVKPEERSKFTDLIKALSDRQSHLTFILAGVAERAGDLIDNLRAVQRHITAISVPPLDHSDLEKIIDEGFRRLGIVVDVNAKSLILARSAGLANEVHRYCLDCFHALGERINTYERKSLFIGTYEFELAESYHPSVG